ncbi:unnamed protein product [Diamesa serratosioi]
MALPKATTVKEAIKRFEDRFKCNATEAKEVQLQFQYPGIERLDPQLGTLVKCQKLSLSTNMIDKITGLNGMKSLKILSAGRNYIKTISGLDCVADTLEELWLSYNLIEKLKGINILRRLRVFYLSNNLVKDWVEFNRLQEIPTLEELLFVGNPLCEGMEESVWKVEAARRLPALKKLDGEPVIREEPTNELQEAK